MGDLTEDLIRAASRYMLAVKRLGEDSGYNRLTYFEAPVSKMPTERMAAKAGARWVELNDAGLALTEAITAIERCPSPLTEKE